MYIPVRAYGVYQVWMYVPLAYHTSAVHDREGVRGHVKKGGTQNAGCGVVPAMNGIQKRIPHKICTR